MGDVEVVPLSEGSSQAAAHALLRRLAGREPVLTPISAVYIGDDTVWKLRRAVKLNFLDFTTLAERERTSRREFELNAPNAAGMYQDVVPVTQTVGGAELNGTGVVIDWVVRMARVPAADFLDEIAKSDRLSPAMLDQLADAVAAMHAALPAAERDWLAGIRSTLDGNYTSCLAAGMPEKQVATWRDKILAELEARSEWVTARAAAGFVRRTHGDLHLGNICLWQGHPAPFDAMEFSESMATIDLSYDLAFLLMDLDIRAGRAAANRVLNRYVARTGDVGLVPGLAMFLSMRAIVRAHVSCHGGGQWQHYLAYAQEVLEPAACVVVGIGGLPGSGKSTLARGLAPQLGRAPGALILRSDETRKRRFGVSPEQHLPREAYAEAVNRAVMAEIFKGVAESAAAGHAVIADLTFMADADRAAAAEAAGQVPFVGLWLQAPMAVLEARIASRTSDASDADLAVLRRIAPSDPGPGRWVCVDATDPQLLDNVARHVTKLASMC